MRKLTTLLSLAALLALPALAMASTPVKGAEKRAVVAAVARADHLVPFPSAAQAGNCWSVRSYRGFASAIFGLPSAKVHYSACQFSAVENGRQYTWQPDASLLKHTAHGWVSKFRYDDPPGCSFANSHGVPTPVYRALVYKKCSSF